MIFFSYMNYSLYLVFKLKPFQYHFTSTKTYEFFIVNFFHFFFCHSFLQRVLKFKFWIVDKHYCLSLSISLLPCLHKECILTKISLPRSFFCDDQFSVPGTGGLFWTPTPILIFTAISVCLIFGFHYSFNPGFLQ